MFQVLRALARRDWAAVVGLAAEGGTPQEELELALAPFFAEHAAIRLDATARAPDRTVVTRHDAEGVWDVVQLFSAPAGADADEEDGSPEAWALACQVDLAASAAAARPVFQIRGVSR
jgi:hypothetical protein